MGRRGLRLFGHPVHPMLAGFPVAFWIGGSACDGLALLRHGSLWPQGAFWLLVAGTVLALPTAASGLWDFLSVPPGHAAERVGYWHMGAMAGALSLNVASVALRRDDLGVALASPTAMALALGGAILCMVGGWLGGELVFRHGVAVDESGSIPDAEEARSR